MKKLKTFLIALFSAGWLLPVCLSVSAFRNYLEFTLIPQITGHGFLPSFPYLEASFVLFLTAACWLAVVIFGWAVHLCIHKYQ